MFQTVPLSIIRSLALYTQQWYMSYGLCWQLASRIRMELYSTRLLTLDIKPVRNLKSSILIIVQRAATQSSLFIILQVHSTCFGCQPHPSTGVRKTVTTASGTVQLPPSNVAKLATLEGDSCTKNMTSTGGWRYSTVLCTADDGRGWHPKHVEWTCRIINRLLCFHFITVQYDNSIY